MLTAFPAVAFALWKPRLAPSEGPRSRSLGGARVFAAPPPSAAACRGISPPLISDGLHLSFIVGANAPAQRRGACAAYSGAGCSPTHFGISVLPLFRTSPFTGET